LKTDSNNIDNDVQLSNYERDEKEKEFKIKDVTMDIYDSDVDIEDIDENAINDLLNENSLE